MDLNKIDNMISVSIIIVHYKTPQLLLECVHSIIDTSKDMSYEIIIVDNNSEDESETLIKTNFPQAKWINTGYNAGFARANNAGIRIAVGEHIFLLNPDALLTKDYLAKMIKHYHELSVSAPVGLLTSRILSSIDNSLLVGTGIEFSGIKKEWGKNPFVIKWAQLFKQKLKKDVYHAEQMHYKNHEVDYVSGACTLINRDTLLKLNLFLDEDFFLYWEDVEWSFRVKKNGLKNYFFAGAEIFHVNSASTGKSKNWNAQIRISEFLYFSKRYNYFNFHLLGLLIRFNYFINSLLLKRKKDKVLESELNFDRALFKEYFYETYKKSFQVNSNNHSYLKYVQKTVK
jgi:GT2 family glycosyltransferase